MPQSELIRKTYEAIKKKLDIIKEKAFIIVNREKLMKIKCILGN